MQITWYPGISLAAYARNRYCANFPLITKCPICGAEIKLYRHGFYSRNVVTRRREYRVDICRYLCRSCRGTVSLLPAFLLPYFQQTRMSILQSLKSSFSRGLLSPYRQLAVFYRQRLLRNLPAIINALREKRLLYHISDDEKERAIKVIGRLANTPPRAMTSKGHYANRILYNFMANSL